ncbi:DoxX family protein [Tenggerimyces flavus]|uniref:DoxX family protein n=1 Tax=Tenggerimyces flavus TaxID=1708749 RepID=A0ABV7YE01_9ACTN|nr:DoxX family protein [Tenggerimyces flavus]MBM7789118.1 putative membrane protein YphA (DoxX/SURF4 family) [Tenggerimyces flavus]
MTATTAPVVTRNRTGRILFLAGRIVLALLLAGGAIPKLIADPTMVTMFHDIGGGDPLRILVGGLELAGAIGLFIRPLRFLAALGLVALLASAAVTNVVALHISPVVPLAYLAVAAAIAVVSWRSRRPLNS